MKNIQNINLSLASIFKVVLVIIAFILLFLIKEIIAVVFLAIIIASAVSLWVGFIEKMYIPKIHNSPKLVSALRMLIVLIIYLVFLSLLGLVFYFIIPVITAEVKQLAFMMPDYYSDISKQIFRSTRDISPEYAKNLQVIMLDFAGQVKDYSSNIFSAISSVFGGVVDFFAIIVISFYLSAQKNGVEDFLKLITPKDNEQYILNLWERVEVRLGKWFQGQMLLALITGCTIFLALFFAGIPYALLLGLIAGMCEILPMVGPIFSALIGISVAALVSPVSAFLTLIIYVAFQQLENHFIVPVLMKKITGLNSVVVIIALLVGAKLAGVIGILLAVPITTILSELLDDFAKKKEVVIERVEEGNMQI